MWNYCHLLDTKKKIVHYTHKYPHLHVDQLLTTIYVTVLLEDEQPYKVT